ncbi:MAG TPA: HlyD family secretion protein, partial [Acidiphilium sp.]|nr:HlyD family secretion protein [Acidiphilium sp.]
MSYPTDDRTIDVPDHLQPRPITGRRFADMPPRFGKRMLLLAAGIVLLAASAWYAANWWVAGRFVETTDDAYVGGDVTPIAPHISGYIQSILVHDNQYVRAGQPLVRLDPADYLAALDHASAAVAERKAAVAALQAKYELQHTAIRQAEANLAARQAEATFAAQEATRYRTLANNDAGSRQDAQRALAGVRKAAAAVNAATAAVVVSKQLLSVLQTRITGAKAATRAAEADFRIARLRLGYTTIDSPVDGYVGDRSAQAGAYVPAGTNLLSVVPARGLWVDANFK